MRFTTWVLRESGSLPAKDMVHLSLFVWKCTHEGAIHLKDHCLPLPRSWFWGMEGLRDAGRWKREGTVEKKKKGFCEQESNINDHISPFSFSLSIFFWLFFNFPLKMILTPQITTIYLWLVTYKYLIYTNLRHHPLAYCKIGFIYLNLFQIWWRDISHLWKRLAEYIPGLPYFYTIKEKKKKPSSDLYKM